MIFTSWIYSLPEYQQLLLSLATIVSIILGIFKLIEIIFKGFFHFRAQKIKSRTENEAYYRSFSRQEIAESLSLYIEPDCAQNDPSNYSDLRKVADVRESIFRSLDRFVRNSGQRKHLLILADSGMGKTSLVLNYFQHLIRLKYSVNVVSLSSIDSIEKISEWDRKSESILLLDALDEDSDAQNSVNDRLFSILKSASDYKSVIVTCRSQFFLDRDSIPGDTNVSVIVPRKGGESPTYKLYHLYILPFDDRQIAGFIYRRFPIWKISSFQKRKKSFQLVNKIPELSVRPMLLDLLPDLVESKEEYTEIFDLYTYMVERWVDREKRWIDRESLINLSQSLAVFVHRNQLSSTGDRVSRAELGKIFQSMEISKDVENIFSTRSLVNRDDEGRVKFAHRSIMEYFFVSAALNGASECFDVPWTDVMRELFVSWGYTSDGLGRGERASEILKMDLSRTTLSPLSHPPSPPAIISTNDFVKSAHRRSTRNYARRLAPPQWRADSVTIKIGSHGYVITDLENDLIWNLPDWSSLDGAEFVDEFMLSFAKLLSSVNIEAVGRPPSYEEFVTLLEALIAVGRSDIIPIGIPILLGDKLGSNKHLLVVVHKVAGFDVQYARLIDAGRLLAGSDLRLSVFGFGMDVDPQGFQHGRGVSVRVRPGNSSAYQDGEAVLKMRWLGLE